MTDFEADMICAELRRRGYNVAWREATKDRLAIAFDMIGNPELPWLRAFHADEDVASPDEFERLINEWKSDVLKRMHSGEASETLKAVVQAYGAERMGRALTRHAGALN